MVATLSTRKAAAVTTNQSESARPLVLVLHPANVGGPVGIERRSLGRRSQPCYRVPFVPASNSPPEPKELPALIGDIVYEVNQFKFSAARSSEIATKLGRLHMERNAHVESMLVHARCLMDFFNCNNPRKDDVVAERYIPDWSAKVDGGEALAWLETNLGQFIDKRVAHLTAHRQRVDKTLEAHFTDDVITNMDAVVRTFRDRLDPDLRRQFFGEGT